MALKVMNEALKKAVTLVDGQTALAKLIGTKQQNVWQWLYDTGKPMSEYLHCHRTSHIWPYHPLRAEA
jgi:hypothetical protein